MFPFRLREGSALPLAGPGEGVAVGRVDVGARKETPSARLRRAALPGGGVIERGSGSPAPSEGLREDAELQAKMNAIATGLLGGAVTVEFVAGEDEGASPTEEDEPLPTPDKDDLLAAGDVEDPASIVVDMLGGEVVSE